MVRGYLCATSHIIYKMGYQGGTCVQLRTSSTRWGIRVGTCVQLHTSSPRWGSGGLRYLCATSHIIYEMGYQGGTCVQLYLDPLTRCMYNLTTHLSSDDDGVGVWFGVKFHIRQQNFLHTHKLAYKHYMSMCEHNDLVCPESFFPFFLLQTSGKAFLFVGLHYLLI